MIKIIKNTLVQFAITFILICIVWFGGDYLESVDIITPKQFNLMALSIFLISIAYWGIKYLKEEKII